MLAIARLRTVHRGQTKPECWYGRRGGDCDGFRAMVAIRLHVLRRTVGDTACIVAESTRLAVTIVMAVLKLAFLLVEIAPLAGRCWPSVGEDTLAHGFGRHARADLDVRLLYHHATFWRLPTGPTVLGCEEPFDIGIGEFVDGDGALTPLVVAALAWSKAHAPFGLTGKGHGFAVIAGLELLHSCSGGERILASGHLHKGVALLLIGNTCLNSTKALKELLDLGLSAVGTTNEKRAREHLDVVRRQTVVVFNQLLLCGPTTRADAWAITHAHR